MSIEDDKINDTIARSFKELGKKVTNKILKTHLKKYAKQLEMEIESIVPTETKELKRKIKAKVGKRSTIAANYLVGVNISDFKTANNPKASIQEYGSKNRNIPEQSYMRKAFDAKVESINNNLQNDIIKDIEEQL